MILDLHSKGTESQGPCPLPVVNEARLTLRDLKRSKLNRNSALTSLDVKQYIHATFEVSGKPIG